MLKLKKKKITFESVKRVWKTVKLWKNQVKVRDRTQNKVKMLSKR